MKTKLMKLADVFATQMIHAHYHPVMEARAALEAEIDRVMAENERLREALERLARLGNEPHYGNSIGNDIARAALGEKS